jgi:20S proteasome subunit alpha 7
MYVHAFTLGGTRPFGVQTVLASADTDGSLHLYMIDPAGQFFEYYACTAGKGRQICKTELDKLDLANLTVRDSVYQLAKMLHKTHEEARDR